MNVKVKNALISVSNKESLVSLLKTLKKYNINIISSGGTYAAIKKLGYKCTELSKYTGFKEMLDGRVKLLHPKIHAGILHDRQNKKHKSEMSKQNFPPIDLIVVNFYPFQKIVTSKQNPKQIIENIDIGGPTMVRAAAKNFKNVTIVTNRNDYGALIKELEKTRGKTSLKFRELMSSKAFGLTAYYDALTAIIGLYFAKHQGLQTLKSGMINLYQNKIPIYEMMSGASIAIAAFLLIIPGFFTDLIGFLLLIPYTRKILFNLTLRKKTKNGNQTQSKTIDGEIIDNNKDEL